MKHEKFTKKRALPDSYYLVVKQAFGDDFDIKVKYKYTNKINPGDIITFSYNKEKKSNRRALIVAVEGASLGRYKSSKGNKLLCVYDITEVTRESFLEIIFSYFYKKNKPTYQKMKKTMNSIFGKNLFKTFDISYMSDIYGLEVER